MLLPKARLPEHAGQDTFRAIKGATKTRKEPLQPSCDFETVFLRRFQNVVIRFALLTDLRRHAVKALWALFGARKRHVGNGARDAPIAVIERVNGHEPQMRDPGL